MRAKTVNEEVNFERGRDPKESLGIGFHQRIANQVKKIYDIDHSPDGWKCTNEVNYDKDEGALVISTYPGDSCTSYLKGILDQLGIGQFFKNWYSYPDEYGFALKKKYQDINEAQEFERGKNPKKALGVGGLDLGSDYERRIEDYKMAISGATVSHTDEWIEFLKDNLRGKEITAEMKMLRTFSVGGDKPKPINKSDADFSKREQTITVQDVKPSWGMGDDFSVHIGGSPLSASPPKLIVADMENNIYEMPINQKIYFEDES